MTVSRVVNSFENERAVEILTNCCQAMSGKSKLLLVQRVLPNRVEHSRHVTGRNYDGVGNDGEYRGRERNKAEHCDLLAADVGEFNPEMDKSKVLQDK